MYALASQLIGLPILSLQNAETITRVTGLIMEIKSLEIVAFQCESSRELGKHPVLLLSDIRQVAIDCLLVNTAEDLVEAEDIVRLAPLLKRDFDPRGLKVVTDLKRKVGTVEDYTINLQTYQLQKIYVRQSLARSWVGASLIIDRGQIIEVSEREFTVRDATVTVPSRSSVLAPKPVPKR
jgi:sporulation protein YlmC with PRC-barrel domain